MAAIEFTGVSYAYQKMPGKQTTAVDGVSLKVSAGAFVALVGQTGSGKSTLMQLLDGLLLPTTGTIKIGELTLTPATDKKVLAQVHRKVGYVFQFPEKQLFAPTVVEDVAFGPLNLGMDPAAAQQAAERALDQLHFPRALFKQPPLELSGGQMRRVALAGVLAMEPEILILDEPTAGLDPGGEAELMQVVQELNGAGKTIMMITHQMDQVAALANQVLVLNQGRLIYDGGPKQLFNDRELMERGHLLLPRAAAWANRFGVRAGGWPGDLPLTLDALAAALVTRLKGGNGDE